MTPAKMQSDPQHLFGPTQIINFESDKKESSP